MPYETVNLRLTTRQIAALRALAALEELPPEVYAAEVLVKHLYHAYTPEVAARAEALSAEKERGPEANSEADHGDE